MTLTLLFITGLGIYLIVASVSAYGDAARSSYTQAHGVFRDATVISEHTTTGKDATSALAVRLSKPVNGHGTTTVHMQGTDLVYVVGSPITVVVDPQDPGYAELPGARYTSSERWAMYLVLGLAAILAFPCAVGIEVLRQLRSRRRPRRSLPR